MTTNRYHGTCNRCFQSVPAREGEYRHGAVYHVDGDAECDRIAARIAEREEYDRKVSHEVWMSSCDPTFVPTLPEAIERIAEFNARKAEEAVSPAGIERARKEAERRARFAAEDAAWAARGLTRCDRCGGVGHSEAWRSTGYACYECGGAGAVSA